MTREEAINYLKRNFSIDEDDASRYHNEVLEFIIKALGQEPCEYAISREAVKELFQEGSVMGMYHFLGIDKLPSVTPKKEGWIPCSERMPENNGVYLVTIIFDIDETESGRDVTKAYFCSQSKKWQYFSNDEVVAWMPLPEPYKAEMESKE